MKVQSFYDLEVYQVAFEVQQEIFELSKHFSTGETYSLTDQIRRSSRSVGANIAEAWRKRKYPAHFASKLTDSEGENAETQHWLRTAEACEYLNASTNGTDVSAQAPKGRNTLAHGNAMGINEIDY